MAKYYVESGEFKLVCEAHTQRGAALWAVHRCLSQSLPFLGADESENDLQPRKRLDAKMQVNEVGFQRGDAKTYDTFELVTEWNHLMVALGRLEEELAAREPVGV
ncbi:hypothetical protein Psta_2593 [Pirellula staleyi DSM 6068]|uniref:Uncharacterized protein n=1 Tax=Pirellula staleyi (strain ATCC 27377 / DSM 6068 / ICPB 4128) TaxID=530564 RepID=D2R5T0_PIRSD|nr:hypothetical protein [Pirellula staleyi]ADB17262.1 hypothetical protein Psta_2593 [Pirellula staleyi DSM 6068]